MTAEASATERSVSALVGYSCAAVVVLPFDRVKSLMQVSDTARRQGAIPLTRHIFARQGLSGLYKGGAVHMLISPYTVFYYSMYTELLSWGRTTTFSSSRPNGHPLVPLGAACLARSVETCVRMPLELLRTMMQAQSNSPPL